MLPHDAKARKALPLYTFLTQYFPDAIAELVKVSVKGNEQHNPGQPMNWARGKSTDQLDAAMRHLFDHGVGIRFGVDGQRTLAQAAWRLLAQLQLDLEKETAVKAPGAAIGTPPAGLVSLITSGSLRDEGELLYATPKLILKLESDDPDTVGESDGSVRTYQKGCDAQGPREKAWNANHCERHQTGSREGSQGCKACELRQDG